MANVAENELNLLPYIYEIIKWYVFFPCNDKVWN